MDCGTFPLRITIYLHSINCCVSLWMKIYHLQSLFRYGFGQNIYFWYLAKGHLENWCNYFIEIMVSNSKLIFLCWPIKITRPPSRGIILWLFLYQSESWPVIKTLQIVIFSRCFWNVAFRSKVSNVSLI